MSIKTINAFGRTPQRRFIFEQEFPNVHREDNEDGSGTIIIEPEETNEEID